MEFRGRSPGLFLLCKVFICLDSSHAYKLRKIRENSLFCVAIKVTLRTIETELIMVLQQQNQSRSPSLRSLGKETEALG